MFYIHSALNKSFEFRYIYSVIILHCKKYNSVQERTTTRVRMTYACALYRFSLCTGFHMQIQGGPHPITGRQTLY